MQKLFGGFLIVGAVLFTLEATMYVAHIVMEMGQPIQPSYGQRNWLSLEGFYSLLQILLGFLVFAVVLAHPVGAWFFIARRQRIRKRLEVTPAPHGKYLPWGRNLRRHPSIPARYGALRSRKSLRPARRRAGLR